MPVPPLLETLYPGDDFNSLTQFRNSDGSTNDYTGFTITAVLIDSKGNALTSPTTLNPAASGAAWATGLILVNIPSSKTAGLQYLLSDFRVFVEIKAVSGAGLVSHLTPIPLQIAKGSL